MWRPESDLPRFATARSGLRFYSPKLGRWLSRDPIGERGGINRYAFLGNRPMDDVDVLGLLGCAPSLPAQRAAVKGILGGLSAEYGSLQIWEVTQLDDMLATLKTTVDAINNFDLSASGPAWAWLPNRLELPVAATYDDATHEVMHAHNDIVAGIGSVAVDGAMAWTVDAHLLRAMPYFKQIETMIAGNGCDALYASPPEIEWRAAWLVADYTGQTYSEPGPWIWSPPVTFTLGDPDAANVQTHFGFHLSCAEIASTYNAWLSSKSCSCLQFVCDPAVAGPGLLRPTKALPIGLQ
jgi:RHS repeat-associated protein